jgi:hypothetical protein
MYDLHDAYFIENFDFAEYTRYFHPDDLASIESNDPAGLPSDQFYSGGFRNIMVSRWHYNYDNYTRILGLIEQIGEIERLIEMSLSDLDE